MPITNDGELALAVQRASRLVQEIHDYTQREQRDDAKINFPRGLIRTADFYRNQCPGYLIERQRSSCAYGFMYLDVLWWLSWRTDISNIAKEMVIKSAIITLGSILEAVLTIPREGIFAPASKAGVKLRLNQAQTRGWINEEERDDLKTLWDHRNNVHLRLLDTHEFAKYRTDHFNQPANALATLMQSLSDWYAH